MVIGEGATHSREEHQDEYPRKDRAGCSPSAPVGQFEAIEEERGFGSSLTAEGAEDEFENRWAVG